VALYAETKEWAERFEGLFTVKDIQAQGHARMQDRSVSISGFDLTGKNLEAGADLDLVGGLASGLLYLKFHGIDVGLELQDNERDWKIIRARKWFDEARAKRQAEAESPDAVGTEADEVSEEQEEKKQENSD
jgi:hypothetical protein